MITSKGNPWPETGVPLGKKKKKMRLELGYQEKVFMVALILAFLFLFLS